MRFPALKEALTTITGTSQIFEAFSLAHSAIAPDSEHSGLVGRQEGHRQQHRRPHGDIRGKYQAQILALMTRVIEFSDFSHLRHLEDGEEKAERAERAVAALVEWVEASAATTRRLSLS